MMLRAFAIGLAAALWAGLARAEDLRVFFYGNSLVHHLTESDETAVPHWLARLAEAGGQGFAADGTFGFLPDFAANLPPEPEWRFDAVRRAWDGSAPFGGAGFDAVVLSPTNFIQAEPPDAETYHGNAVALTARVLGWTADQFPEGERPRVLIYEGWSKMGDITSYPPGRRGLARWHNWNLGYYHDWYDEYVSRLNEELPGLDAALIPVSTVLSTLMTEEPLAAIPVEALFSDDAPHGTATTYLLAAMITYAALYGETPPDLPLGPSIHPILVDTYAAVAARIAELTGASPRPEAVADPSLGMGLNGIADWSTQHPFLDVLKTARPWIGHTPEEWGAWDNARLEAGGYLSPAGWPLRLPPGVDRLETLVLTGQPAAARSLAGTYVLRWEGGAEVSVAGMVEDVRRHGRSLRFTYRPGGEGLVAVAVSALDPADPLRAMTLVREENLALFDGGAVFDPAFLARIRDFRALRFMDWMATNDSPQVRWEDRPRVDDASWMQRGVPVEIMVQLANEVGADPWFTLPHQADDAYATAFATYVRDHLDPRLKVYAEWSNEVWNFMFGQAHWAGEQARARWGEAAGGDSWMQFAGLRAAEVADIWGDVFGQEAERRLVRVVAVHTGWLGLEEPLLDAPLAVAEGRPPPAASFDAYAVTGYFGHAIAAEENAPRLRAWIAAGVARDQVTTMARTDIEALTEEIWPYHAQVARDHGYRLVAYEGGTHIVGQGAVTEDEAITSFLSDYSYSLSMASLYRELLAGWSEAGGTLFMPFVDTSGPSRWGAWGGLRHPDDRNPRWGAILAANAVPPAWEARDPATFAQGVQISGGPAGDTLTGTPEEDDLLGLGGDDLLASEGGSDRLHGGAGRDRARVPGVASDWTRGTDGAATLLTRGGVTIRLTAVEEVEFIGSGETLALADER